MPVFAVDPSELDWGLPPPPPPPDETGIVAPPVTGIVAPPRPGGPGEPVDAGPVAPALPKPAFSPNPVRYRPGGGIYAPAGEGGGLPGINFHFNFGGPGGRGDGVRAPTEFDEYYDPYSVKAPKIPGIVAPRPEGGPGGPAGGGITAPPTFSPNPARYWPAGGIKAPPTTDWELNAARGVSEPGQMERQVQLKFITAAGSPERGTDLLNAATDAYTVQYGHPPSLGELAQMNLSPERVKSLMGPPSTSGAGGGIDAIARRVASGLISEEQGYQDAMKAGFKGSFNDFLIEKDAVLHRGGGHGGGGGAGIYAPVSPGMVNLRPGGITEPNLRQTLLGDTVVFDDQDLGALPEAYRGLIARMMAQLGYTSTGFYGAYGPREYKRAAGTTAPTQVTGDVLNAVAPDQTARSWLNWWAWRKGMLGSSTAWPGTVTAPAA